MNNNAVDYISKYTDFIKKQALIKRPMSIVCDASNGTASIVLKKLTNIPNLKLILINTELNADFPAHGPNPLEPGATDDISKKVIETKADFGVVFDADGDRAFFVDNTGKIVPSFVSAMILFKNTKPPFVTDELVYMSLSSSGLLDQKDIIPTPVGSIFIKEAMKKSDAVLGAEYSGHFYFKNFFGLDSGILTMINMTNTISNQEKTFAQLHAEISNQYTGMANVNLKKASWLQVKDALKKETASYAKDYAERDGLTFTIKNGWVNVRPSNTEPLVRISVGTQSEKETTNAIADTVKIITKADV